MNTPEELSEQLRLLRGSVGLGAIVPRSRLIISHACVLLAGFALGAWLWPSATPLATPPENNRQPVPVIPGAGTSASDMAGREEPKKDSAPITGETYIRIPLRLAEDFSVPMMTDPKLNDLLIEVLELSVEQRQRFDDLMEKTSAKLREVEFQNMTVETPAEGGVLIKIPQMKGYAQSKGAFKQTLVSIIGEAKADFFMEAARSSLRMSLSGEFGEFPRNIHITPTTSGYDVREESFSIWADGTKHNIGYLTTTFEDELPSRLKHLVELLPKK